MEYKNHSIKICQDEFPDSPRSWYNLGSIICFHRRYNIGDDHSLTSDQFSSWEDLKKYIQKNFDPLVILPVYLYDHSGLCLKIGSFHGLLPQGHAEFDSGQVGFIYVSKDKVRKELSCKRISQKTKLLTIGRLIDEINIYNQYLSGDIWGYTVSKNGEIIDSCAGIYGLDNVMYEAKNSIDSQGRKQNEITS